MLSDRPVRRGVSCMKRAIIVLFILALLGGRWRSHMPQRRCVTINKTPVSRGEIIDTVIDGDCRP